MQKTTVYERYKDEHDKWVSNTLELPTVDAQEAVANDPGRYSLQPFTKAQVQEAGEVDPDSGPQTRYKLEKIVGTKTYNVIDTANGEIVESGLEKAAAKAKATELGGGHATTSPNV